MAAYYNENDKYAAAWLRELISEGLIAAGDVDDRSIVEVRADDLRGYEQCHFFAGVGGWSAALRLASWEDDRPVWTGSCPCQPLSSAGQRKGHADERHLWPAFHRLISERSPAIVFGEQVASIDGREWFAGVRADLEALGYACGGADLCAAGIASPQVRPRIYWLAHADRTNKDERPSGRQQSLHDKDDTHPQRLGGAESEQRDGRGQAWRGRREFADADFAPWPGAEIAECDDGLRRIEPGAQPLVDGLPGRLDMLRGYGNAILPALGAKFIRASIDAIISSNRL